MAHLEARFHELRFMPDASFPGDQRRGRVRIHRDRQDEQDWDSSQGQAAGAPGALIVAALASHLVIGSVVAAGVESSPQTSAE